MGDGLGLQGAWGLASLQASIRQRQLDRMAAQQREFENMIALRTANRADTQQQLVGQQHLDALAETKRLHDQEDAARIAREGDVANQAIPPGTDIPGSSPFIGRLMEMGAVQPKALTQQVPASIALDPTATTTDIPGTIANSPSPTIGRLYTKTATQQQKEKAIADARLQQTSDASLDIRKQLADVAGQSADIRGRMADIAAENARLKGEKLVKVEHQDPTTGRTVIEWLPESQVRGHTFQKGPGSATETRLASAQAVNQTGEDIIAQVSKPEVAAKLGPAMGRFAKLQDFIGNPPPEYSELAGAIESYALANMGVHGMRSAQGAAQIASLLNQPHTPESLIASIRGLNKFSTHFMENEGRPTSAPKKGPVRYDMNGNVIK